MGDDQKGSGTPPKPIITQGVWFGVIVSIGIVVGRVASDAVQESLGWWWSLGVGIFVAAVTSLIAAYLVQAWQQRGGR